ncbi:glycosyltransferase family 2 protein [Rhodococcus maanshanensis]|uniref:Glycosyltransferase involved in cell wall bisynthesis n=1 Tax=Rhodococcus maanshanensis TaxID=183556 RepID=A0A1H7MKJ0_9NOCA|nr:glycosyltransferase family 2 protein [Rhodococcus maanshanensis]SEL11806.1 Glycosyltransferase involved in cell wall bisynthesis [Rhodococcus maanshanensis]
MNNAATKVSVGLPVRNGAERIQHVVESVLTQDHQNLELVICDNASTDGTEELCRGLAAQDGRIVYHRNPMDVGLLNNFIGTIRLATGTFFRWVGDDDWLEPHCVSRGLEAFAADDRLILVTSQLAYTGPDGVTQTAAYDGTALGSDDPVTRFTEMLRLLNESHLLIDPLYALVRREPVVRIERRNMLREDEVFATKLALAGPWGHVPEVLARRNWTDDRLPALARKLAVPGWQAHVATTLQCREILRWLAECDLGDQQRRRARLAVARMYARRQRIVVVRRGRKLARIARELVRDDPRRVKPLV